MRTFRHIAGAIIKIQQLQKYDIPGGLPGGELHSYTPDANRKGLRFRIVRADRFQDTPVYSNSEVESSSFVPAHFCPPADTLAHLFLCCSSHLFVSLRFRQWGGSMRGWREAGSGEMWGNGRWNGAYFVGPC